MVCPLPTVRAVASSQSLPTAHTSEPALVVVRFTFGAPLAPFALATAPIVVLAPLKAVTVIEPTYDPLLRVAVTARFDTMFEAAAVQISDVPARVLVRWRNVQVSPPPVTVLNVWAPVLGPSELIKAT